MSPQLQNVITEAQDLSPFEQIELINTVSQFLRSNFQTKPKNNDFWNPKTLRQLMDEQQYRPVKNVLELTSDFWPEEESVDEFIEFIYKQRHKDKFENQ